MKNLKVLIVDDEKGYREEISEFLEDCNFDTVTTERPSEALEIVQKQEIDLAILDLRLPEMSGIELMKQIFAIEPEMAVIMISGHGDMESVIAAMREGATDFFPKPFNLSEIRFAIERTRKFVEMQWKLGELKSANEMIMSVLNRENRCPIIGNSEPIQNVMLQMKKVSASPFTDVLICGESGTGKELVARGIHQLTHENRKILFDVNCTAIPETLFESEFFGHKKNAFTGANEDKKGWFEIANGGTLFLDEIGDMPLSMQAKLLRVLEERVIRKVGCSRSIPLQIRVIASTNKNLKAMIKTNHFREDLYYRLNRFHIEVPPLRERKEDIPALLNFYNDFYAKSIKKKPKPFTSDIFSKLENYDYPGNIRELKNMVEKANILVGNQEKNITKTCFPELDEHNPNYIENDDLNLDKLEALEKKMIKQALQKTNYNKTQAAKLLNITRVSLNRRLEKYKLEI
jgi:DNA-binding NtrC family response regulator